VPAFRKLSSAGTGGAQQGASRLSSRARHSRFAAHQRRGDRAIYQQGELRREPLGIGNFQAREQIAEPALTLLFESDGNLVGGG